MREDLTMSEQNHAGSIIISLASLPDFLRKPILSRRMSEFFSSDPQERSTIISNALAAGPGIPFPNFSRLLKTWLEVLSELPEAQRAEMFSGYVGQIVQKPQSLTGFHLDGILETYCSLTEPQRLAISGTLTTILAGLDPESRRRIRLLVPVRAGEMFGL